MARSSTILIFLFLICFTCNLKLTAQESIVCPQNFITYPLPDYVEEIKGMTVDSNNFLWFGTNTGIVKFDGNSFKKIGGENPTDPNSLIGEMPEALCVIGHDLWIGTKNNGIQRYDIKSDSFYPPINMKSGLQANRIPFLKPSGDSALWVFSHTEGIDLYNYKNGKIYSTKPVDFFSYVDERSSAVNSNMIRQPGNENLVWMSSHDGVFEFNLEERTFTKHFPLTVKNCVNPALLTGRQQTIRDIAFHKGYLWCSTWGGGLVRLNTSTGKFKVYLYEPKNPVGGLRNNIRLLASTGEKLYVLSPHTGFAEFDVESEQFKFLKNPDGSFQINNPGRYCWSNKKDLWITNKNNLFLLKQEPLPFSKLDYGEFILDTKVLFDGSWVSSGYGGSIFQYYPKKQAASRDSFYNSVPVARNALMDIAANSKMITGIDFYGVKWYDENFREIAPYTQLSEPEANTPFIYAFRDSEGQFWLPHKYSGMVRFDPKTNTSSFYENELVWPHWIRTVSEDKTRKVWYGSEKGLGYFDLQKQSFQNFPLEAFSDFSFLPEVALSIMPDAQNRIWCASSRKGIIIFKEENGKIEKVKELTKKDGLQNLVISQLTIGPQGMIWAGHSEGFSTIDPTNFEVTNYGTWTGLSGIHSFYFQNDTLIANSTDGIYIGLLNRMDNAQSAPTPYLSSMALFGKPIKNWDAHSGKFHHSKNYLEFELDAQNANFPSEIQYSYRLGESEEWSQAISYNHLSFPQLPPDDYNLWVKTRYTGGQWSEPALLSSFTINKPYWQTFWFVGLMVLLTGTVVFSIFRYRVNMLKNQAALEKQIQDLEMKSLRVQMNPHFMFNALNSVRYFILKENRDKASDYLTRFSHLLRSIMSATRENFTTLSEELKSLKLYLEFEKTRFSEKFDYSICLADDVSEEGILIQPLILQPFAENAIWHGLMKKDGDGHLMIKIEKQGRSLKITIEDDGIGREAAARHKSKAHKSMGLEITRERLKLLEKRLQKPAGFEIEDLYENGNATGTRVTINYPYNESNDHR